MRLGRGRIRNQPYIVCTSDKGLLTREAHGYDQRALPEYLSCSDGLSRESTMTFKVMGVLGGLNAPRISTLAWTRLALFDGRTEKKGPEGGVRWTMMDDDTTRRPSE